MLSNSGGRQDKPMGLAEEYRRQFAWRSWPKILSLLPAIDGQVVLDLGCGIGDQAAELAARGAHVIGVDANDELLAVARSRKIVNAEFRLGDLKALPDFDDPVDGIWCSFSTAYVPELSPILAGWKKRIKPGGWTALTEVDDLFGHEPLELQTAELLAEYARDTLAKNRYDFYMGRKLRGHLERAGFTIASEQQVPDRELSFDGPAEPEIVQAWLKRLNRMNGLRDLCGSNFERVRGDFLGALIRSDHRSSAKVWCCVATRPVKSDTMLG